MHIPITILLLMLQFNGSSGSPTLGATATTNGIDLTWKPPVKPGAVGYNVYRGTAPGGPYPTKIPVGNVLKLTDVIPSGQKGCYIVKSLDSQSQESAPSNESCAVML